MSKRLLRYNQLKPEKGVPYTREHLARLVKARKFPPPVVLAEDEHGNAKTIAWIEDEVDTWRDELAAKRSAEAA